jgi:hypothetical protein
MGKPGFNNRHRRQSAGSVLLMPDGTNEELSFCRKKQKWPQVNTDERGLKEQLANSN